MAVVDERRSSRFAGLLKPYLPCGAVDTVVQYIIDYKIHFKITRERHTKFGDYRLPTTARPGHCISINGNLEPQGFLLVTLHELAHMLTYVDYGRKVKPHGLEWQRNYSRLIADFINMGCFSDDIVPMLRSYSATLPLNKRMERLIDTRLHLLPAAFDKNGKPQTLDTLPVGSQFRIKGNDGRLFESVAKLRTRWKCRELNTGRIYSVSGSAPVVTNELRDECQDY